MILDPDRFKEINDTLGHEHGDILLTQLGPRFRGVLREVDTVARLGGDEFGILIGGLHDEEEATAVAEKLTSSLTDPLMSSGSWRGKERSTRRKPSGQRSSLGCVPMPLRITPSSTTTWSGCPGEGTDSASPDDDRDRGRGVGRVTVLAGYRSQPEVRP